MALYSRTNCGSAASSVEFKMNIYSCKETRDALRLAHSLLQTGGVAINAALSEPDVVLRESTVRHHWTQLIGVLTVLEDRMKNADERDTKEFFAEAKRALVNEDPADECGIIATLNGVRNAISTHLATTRDPNELEWNIGWTEASGF